MPFESVELQINHVRINHAFIHEIIRIWQRFQRNLELSGTSNLTVSELTIPDL